MRDAFTHAPVPQSALTGTADVSNRVYLELPLVVLAILVILFMMNMGSRPNQVASMYGNGVLVVSGPIATLQDVSPSENRRNGNLSRVEPSAIAASPSENSSVQMAMFSPNSRVVSIRKAAKLARQSDF
jgi:hypothetical protein